jgi:hypothetical protein
MLNCAGNALRSDMMAGNFAAKMYSNSNQDFDFEGD